VLARGLSGVPGDGGHDTCQPLVAQCLCACCYSQEQRERDCSLIPRDEAYCIYVYELSVCRCPVIIIDRVQRAELPYRSCGEVSLIRVPQFRVSKPTLDLCPRAVFHPLAVSTVQLHPSICSITTTARLCLTFLSHPSPPPLRSAPYSRAQYTTAAARRPRSAWCAPGALASYLTSTKRALSSPRPCPLSSSTQQQSSCGTLQHPAQ
jgi:hypothetical protein